MTSKAIKTKTALADPQLRSFATQRELDFLEAMDQHGSVRAAARHLGLNKNSIEQAMVRLRQRAAMRGYSPDHSMTHPAPEGFLVKGVSTLYGEDGAPRAQWVKTKLDDAARAAAYEEFIRDLAQGIKGLAPLTSPPTLVLDDLLAVYPIGDPHFGMKADGADTGHGSWDLEIAAGTHESAVDYLCSIAPPARQALLINCGDALHVNDSSNTTPTSGAQLDVDTRYGKMLDTAAMSFVKCILRLLQKHEHVTVWCMRGNHDIDSSLALQIALKLYFHNEPRVTVDDGTSYYKYLRFGQNLIGSHHGHGAKMNDLPLLMATDRPQDWGQTRHRVWHVGHIHHKTVTKDFSGCTVESHRTLAAQDAWHAAQGYRAQRDMQMIVYHRELGEVQRSRCDPAALSQARH